jgi:hypothetical protein
MQPNRLPELRIYFDTSPLLPALGLASDEVVLAAKEMLALMRSFKVRCSSSATPSMR